MDERHGLLQNYSNNIADTVTNNVDSIHVNGPWSITFEWEKGDAFRVDLEQYH
jgi:plasmid maintenance system killer protein